MNPVLAFGMAFLEGRQVVLTAPRIDGMQKDDLIDVQTQKAALLLKRAYARMKYPSWSKVAKKYGLANKSRANMIANGKLRVNPEKDQALMRAILRENDATHHPKTFLRAIRKIAIPFLEARQQSPTHLYVRGGKPWKGWGR